VDNSLARIALTINHISKKKAKTLEGKEGYLLQVEEEDFSGEQIEWVVKQFHTLSEKHRQVLNMRYYQKMTVTQIAKELGITQPTASHHISMALKIMRKRARSQGLLAFLLPWNWGKQITEIVVMNKITQVVVAVLVLGCVGLVGANMMGVGLFRSEGSISLNHQTPLHIDSVQKIQDDQSLGLSVPKKHKTKSIVEEVTTFVSINGDSYSAKELKAIYENCAVVVGGSLESISKYPKNETKKKANEPGREPAIAGGSGPVPQTFYHFGSDCNFYKGIPQGSGAYRNCAGMYDDPYLKEMNKVTVDEKYVFFMSGPLKPKVAFEMSDMLVKQINFWKKHGTLDSSDLKTLQNKSTDVLVVDRAIRARELSTQYFLDL